MLLQILEDGKLTDSVGRVVNFRNTIILMTSNVGSEHQTAVKSRLLTHYGRRQYERCVKKSWKKPNATFKPEFLNVSTMSSCSGRLPNLT